MFVCMSAGNVVCLLFSVIIHSSTTTLELLNGWNDFVVHLSFLNKSPENDLVVV